MKINQVEELVGVTKKNIRFYEDEGLLRPERNPANGYRDYSLKDVERLQTIKLLRRLDVPCAAIRQVLEGERTLSDCLDRHMRDLEKRERDVGHMRQLCERLKAEAPNLADLNAAEYLETMKTLEKGGVTFVDTEKSDVNKRRGGAILSAVVWVVLMGILILAALWGNRVDPLPTGVLIAILAVPAAVIIGVVIALIQRMKELKGGEYDEARKY